MRIHITHPDYFARLGTKIVLVFDNPAGPDKVLIRRDNGDFDTVLSEKLEEVELGELTQTLMSNITLREMAQNEGLIDIGDVHTDDGNYVTMFWRHS